MKRLIIILLIIFYSCGPEKKERVINLDGAWVSIGERDNSSELTSKGFFLIDDLNEDGDELIYEYMNIKGNKGDFGAAYGFKFSELSMDYDVESDFISLSKKKGSIFFGDNTDIGLPFLISDDTLIMKVPNDLFSKLWVRLPKYTSQEAKNILEEKKKDLDLELITKSEYDKIKNSLVKFIK